MHLNDASRRGLRTAIDLLLSGGLTGLILFVLSAFGVEVTLEQFTAVILGLAPLLSVVKNALEDSTGRAFLVSKTRPEPDPTVDTEAPVQAAEQTEGGWVAAQDGVGSAWPDLSGVVMLAPLPAGMVLIAVDADEVQESDVLVGYTT